MSETLEDVAGSVMRGQDVDRRAEADGTSTVALRVLDQFGPRSCSRSARSPGRCRARVAAGPTGGGLSERSGVRRTTPRPRSGERPATSGRRRRAGRADRGRPMTGKAPETREDAPGRTNGGDVAPECHRRSARASEPDLFGGESVEPVSETEADDA